MTDFSSICDILGKLYANYKEDKNFRDFIEFNDLGLPLAYLTSENLCQPSDMGLPGLVDSPTAGDQMIPKSPSITTPK
jgi:hypothetical protein